ncbi:MAG: hypothetical protein FJ291_21155 [Planctomycetes bacterium]|nr:hypothetical protein [Planctomycetota bacterium]
MIGRRTGRHLSAAQLLLIALALGCGGVPRRSEGNGGHPPPSVTLEELAESQLIMADPKATPTQQVGAISHVTFRPSGEVALPLRALLESTAKDEKRALAVRLNAAQGFCFAFREEAGPMRVLLRKLQAQAVEDRDALTVSVLADALRNGSYLNWPWLARDVGAEQESRSIARRALSHEAAEVRKGGLRLLGHCGVAADANLVRPFLSNPLRDEFHAALDLVWHNTAIAGALRDVVWQVVSSETVVHTSRVWALHALQAPWGEKELAVARGLFRKDPDANHVDIAKKILLRATAEDAARSLVSVGSDSERAKVDVLGALSSALHMGLRSETGSWYPPREREGARPKVLAVARVPALAQALGEWATEAGAGGVPYRQGDEWPNAVPTASAEEALAVIRALDADAKAAIAPFIARGLESKNPHVARRVFELLGEEKRYQIPLRPTVPLLRKLERSQDALVRKRAAALLKQAGEPADGQPR